MTRPSAARAISEGWGGKRAVYFVMQFSKPFASVVLERDGKRLASDASDGKARSMKASFNYATAAHETILVKVGISGTGIEGARKNLAAEIASWDFDGMSAPPPSRSGRKCLRRWTSSRSTRTFARRFTPTSI
jgi:putative alpha-1,2-mannosidase